MAITDKIEDIKTSLKKISKDLSYKKANKERDKKVEAQEVQRPVGRKS